MITEKLPEATKGTYPRPCLATGGAPGPIFKVNGPNFYPGLQDAAHITAATITSGWVWAGFGGQEHRDPQNHQE